MKEQYPELVHQCWSQMYASNPQGYVTYGKKVIKPIVMEAIVDMQMDVNRDTYDLCGTICGHLKKRAIAYNKVNNFSAVYWMAIKLFILVVHMMNHDYAVWIIWGCWGESRNQTTHLNTPALTHTALAWFLYDVGFWM